ncbi:MAG: leucyl/phenylalanyl-tRNA--protein transferase [Halioglobus sp.]|jgi:leucyl/phenylalanyl-tRNA--protein transferase
MQQRRDAGSQFPPSSEALNNPNGLLAVGGELSPQRLIAAYQRGIFPWYEEPQPIMWWTPDPRSILKPQWLHISRSLAKTLRKNGFKLSVDQHFSRVIQACAALRSDGPGTWIGSQMQEAYAELHRLGFAHSIEIHDLQDNLVGGLYGVSLGQAFFGESMFSIATNASKVALVALVYLAKNAGIQFIDCQVESDHLNSLGAQSISRLDFERLLDHTVHQAAGINTWALPSTCGELL